MTVDAMTTRPPAAHTSQGRAVTVLFTVTVFLGAGLLFMVQPLVAKLLLPSYGGSATVWSTASLFFQLLLLASYLWVHWSVGRWGVRWQPRIQLVLLVVPMVVLPIALPASSAPDPSTDPALWLLRTLALMIGLPFAVLACTGPLLQRWYSWVGPRGDDPYFLFAASNLGSFVGLLAYPFLIEPRLSLEAQRIGWSVGFAAYGVLMAACAVTAMRGHSPERAAAAVSTPRPAARRILTWGLLAFLPSSLMLGVTAHLSTDVSPIPLLWVVPLAVYLATFVVAFARTSRKPPVWAAWVSSVLAFGGIFTTGGSQRLLPVAVLSVALLAVVGYAAHGRLAADRPPPDHLTLFYVVVAAGGAAGGLLNGLLAPAVLDRVLEYPLVLVCIPFLLLGTAPHRSALRRRLEPVALTAGLVAFALWTSSLVGSSAIDHSRSFYGAYRVTSTGDRHQLVHGNTVHGSQFLDTPRRRLATMYYASPGSCSDVFAAMRGRLDEVGVVGLGAGTIAVHGRAGERFTFFEIDPDIVTTAQDPDLFTFLSDSEAETRVVVGDGRLRVAEQEPGTFDLLVLDAFSSDSIPVHLLTREAMQVYARSLAPDGVLLVHISNRFFDLEPVLAAAADDLGWSAVRGTSRAETPGSSTSTWVALTADPEFPGRLQATEWQPLEVSKPVHWTDDYSSVLSVLE